MTDDMSAVRLNDLAGLWRRTVIAWPDGRSDTTTDAFWLQGPKYFADLRIPRGRPDLPAGSCLRDLDWDMLRFMARQEGFFGDLEVAQSTGHWHRAFDYQPDTGVADRGTLKFEGDVLVERGVESPYVEHWQRESRAGENAMALRLVSGDPLSFGCLIAAGDAFIYARSRAMHLPRNTTLHQLVSDAGSIEAAQNFFDCEISFGRRRGARWEIERSSLPYREGQTLAPALDAASLVIGDVAPTGAASKRAWRIAACESSAADPFFHWFGLESRSDAAGAVGLAARLPMAKLGAD